MPSQDSATARVFVAQRAELHALAARMLGSSADADDAVQETWLRLARIPDPAGIDNPAGWLRTVVSRICLDWLRARRVRGHPVGLEVAEADGPLDGGAVDPAAQAVLADAVGRALLAVLETLDPAERIAFVLHDMFGVPHGEIAAILERSPAAAKKLASRARLKIRGTAPPDEDVAAHRRVVAAFLAAARAGDLDAVLAVLAPDVVRRADPAALPPGAPAVLRGARAVAEGTVLLAGRAADAELVLVDGAPGLVLAPQGRLAIAVTFTVRDGVIHAYDVLADPDRLATLDLALLP
ncbi:sigma-70 family RNA polymerase sigma factor [Pseudonocardia sp. CA-107938]|uniref:sigma-70 family RNA polymerase sigma factor n=1 Tax=Pseudonocardia sp. CA-107938 TaxID=3240021 RepID=UPI003D93A3E9